MAKSAVVRSIACTTLFTFSIATSGLFVSLGVVGNDIQLPDGFFISPLIAGLMNAFALVMMGTRLFRVKCIPISVGVGITLVAAISSAISLAYLGSQFYTVMGLQRGKQFSSIFAGVLFVWAFTLVAQSSLWTFEISREFHVSLVPEERAPRRSSIGTFGFESYDEEATRSAVNDANSKWKNITSRIVSPRLSTRKSFASSKTAIDGPLQDQETLPQTFDSWDTTSVNVINRVAVIASQKYSKPPSIRALSIFSTAEPLPAPPKIFSPRRPSSSSTILSIDCNTFVGNTVESVLREAQALAHEEGVEIYVASPRDSVVVDEDRARTLKAEEIASSLSSTKKEIAGETVELQKD